jgi:hypothetical protein
VIGLVPVVEAGALGGRYFRAHRQIGFRHRRQSSIVKPIFSVTW